MAPAQKLGNILLRQRGKRGEEKGEEKKKGEGKEGGFQIARAAPAQPVALRSSELLLEMRRKWAPAPAPLELWPFCIFAGSCSRHLAGCGHFNHLFTYLRVLFNTCLKWCESN